MASEYVSETFAVAITSLFAQWDCFEGNLVKLLYCSVFIGNKVIPGIF
jgi:hypothetical protein